MSDIIQRTVVDIQGTGADSVSILTQAMEELQTRFKTATGEFAQQKISATELIGVLKSLASGLTEISKIATADADAMAKATAATEKFIEKTNAALEKQDAQEARLDAQAAARMDQKVAKDKATMDAIGAAADKAAAAAEAAADRMAKAQAQASEKMATDALKASRAFEETVISLESLVVSAMKLKSTGIDQAMNQAAVAAEKEYEALELLNQGMIKDTDLARKQLDAFLDMEAAMTMASTKTAAIGQQFGGFSTAAAQAADKTKNVGYAMMNASYLIQDMQYGIGAVANNMGIMAMSMGNAFPKLDAMVTKIGVPGGLTGLGAGIMFAAVATDLLYKNWDTIAAAFQGGLPPKLFHDIDGLTKTLKELESIKIKTNIDYANIKLARDELQKLTAEESAYNRLKTGKSEEQQKRSEMVSEAITESGGGIDKIIEATEQSLPIEDSDDTINMKGQIARAQKVLDAPVKNAYQIQQAEGEISYAKRKIQENKRREIAARAAKAKSIVTGAAEGRAPDVAALAGMLDVNEDAFAGTGMDVSRFRAGLEAAGDPMREKREKAVADRKKRQETIEANILADEKAQMATSQKHEADRIAKDREVDAIVEDQWRQAMAIQREEEQQRAHVAPGFKKIQAREAADSRAIKARQGRDAREEKAQDRADIKDAGQLGKAYIPQIQGSLAESAMQGGDQAELLNQWIAYLRSQGASEGVAHQITERGLREFNSVAQQNMAIMNDTQSALIATLQDAQNDMMGMQAKLMQNNMKANGLSSQSARNRNARVTSNMTIGP